MMGINASRAVSPTVLHGLVGAWCPSLGPSGYTLLDRSGRGRHGALTNMDAGSDWVGSPGGWAIDFDGTNDYIPVSTGNWASLVSPSLLLTISVWVLFRSTSRQSLFADWSSSGGQESLRLEMSGYNITPGHFGGNILRTGAQSPIITPTAVPVNQWHHFVVQRTPSGERLFWNGATAASNSSAVNSGWLNHTAAIGRAGDYPAFYCNALVGDVGLWNRDITDAEAKLIYKLGRGGLGRLLTHRRRRVYSTAGPAFNAAWASRATTIAGVLR